MLHGSTCLLGELAITVVIACLESLFDVSCYTSLESQNGTRLDASSETLMAIL